MKLFLDTSVLLAASGLDAGASSEIFRLAPVNRWDLLTTPYVIDKIILNLPQLPLAFNVEWMRLRPKLSLMNDVLTPDRPVVFELHKIVPSFLAPWHERMSC